MIIDCHCHAGTGDGLTGPWDTAAPLERLSAARGAGRHRPHGPVCRISFRLCRGQSRGRAHRGEPPGPFYGFVFVHAARIAGEWPRWCARRSSASGLSASRCTATTPASRARFATPPGLCPASTLRRDGRSVAGGIACARVSGVSFIIPHLGSFADDWRAQLALIDHLVASPQCLYRHLGRAALRPAGAGGAARGPDKSCSAPTARGCIPASSSRRYGAGVRRR